MNPTILMQLLPLLQQALAKQAAPNVTTGLTNGYDPGIMNDIFQRSYNSIAADGVDRYTPTDALTMLNNAYGNRTLIPTENAYDAAQTFINNPIQQLPESESPFMNDAYDEDMMRIHEGEGWEDGSNYSNPLAQWYKKHKR